MIERIAAEILDAAVEGVKLRPGTLRNQVGSEASLLVFLRHFG